VGDWKKRRYAEKDKKNPRIIAKKRTTHLLQLVWRVINIQEVGRRTLWNIVCVHRNE
jgi:hypothetical protein